jgi:hypothetical protein
MPKNLITPDRYDELKANGAHIVVCDLAELIDYKTTKVA